MAGYKHRPPTTRAGLIKRLAALEMLRVASDSPVVSIVAPPGYGKTTLMAQFHAEETRPSGWLTLDESDSDPPVLLADLTAALGDAGIIEKGDYPTYRSESVLTRGIQSLKEQLEHAGSGVIFVDQVDHLESQGSLDVLGAFMTRIANESIQLVMASRTGRGLPLALLRSQGTLTELNSDELAMNECEIAQVFEAIGIDTENGLDVVLRKTEGWPAGVYLTALAIQAGAPSPSEVVVRGDDVFLADYLRDELISPIPEMLRDFLVRTSVLPRLSGPLCDYVLDRQDSGRVLAELEESNLLVVPLDRGRSWYRYHSLMRDFLSSEMTRTNPGEEERIHARAAEWFANNGFSELAIEQARKANDLEQFARLFAKSGRQIYSQGRKDTVAGWIDWLEKNDAVADYPFLAAIGAFARSLDGDAGGAERLSRFAFLDRDGIPFDGSKLTPFALMLRSFQLPRGPEQAVADAQTAMKEFVHDPQWLPSCAGGAGLAQAALGGLETSEAIWTEGLIRSQALEAHPFTAYSKAQRALIAIGRDDWDTAGSFVDDSLSSIRMGGLEDYVTSAMGFALAARMAIRRGEVEEASSMLGAASLIRPKLTIALPAMATQTLHEIARAYIEIADVAGARRVMRDASDIIAVKPKLGLFVKEHQSLKEQLSELPAGTVGASSLTAAELRLLPLLVTHLTYPEIGDRLYVSRHTVKTQAMSIYRKLGVSSRAEAVEKARGIGLLSV